MQKGVIRRSLPVVLSALFGSSCVCGQPLHGAEQTLPDDLQAQIAAVFEDFDRSDVAGCAVGVIADGNVTFKDGFGTANLEHAVEITPDTVFSIASTTKQFIAFATLLASRDGYFGLDDDIGDHIPELPDYGTPITIRQMILHTSGLRDYWVLWALAGGDVAGAWTRAEILDLVYRQRSLMFEPGTGWSYSNTGYLLLGELIGRTTGKALRQFADERIFQPLGMHRSLIRDNRNEIVKGRASGHQQTDSGALELLTTGFELTGSGGLYTTATDLLRWAEFLIGNVGGYGMHVREEFLTAGVAVDFGVPLPVAMDYGFGLMMGNDRGERVVRHAGGSLGFRAEMLTYPERDFAAVVLCNHSDIYAQRYAQEIADLVLFAGEAGTEFAPRPGEPEPGAIHLDARQKKRFIGHYGSDEFDTVFEVALIDDQLYLHRHFQEPQILEVLSDSALRASPPAHGLPPIVLKFHGQGVYQSITIDYVRVGVMELSRLCGESCDQPSWILLDQSSR